VQSLNSVDLFVFALYFAVVIGVGFLVARRNAKTADEYFLADRDLPWYVVGTSYIASNISSEHMIGMIGAAYIYGICVALWEWHNIVAFSILIWIFIPFLLASRVFTGPEFLERRFNSTCRLLFAVMTVVANVTAFLAAVLNAGAVGLNALFGWDPTLCIVLLGVTAGSYAIVGGMRSIAWTEVFQTVVIIAGGLLLTVLGLRALGGGSLVEGWATMVSRNMGEGAAWSEGIRRLAPAVLGEGATSYERLNLFQPSSHTLIPWWTLLFGWVTTSIWYNCINQFMIQRVLSARDGWHARMGIVLAGFLKVLMPAIIVIPGLVYFAMDPTLDRTGADKGYASLVMQLVSVGVRGVLLAALFGAIQSTINSVLNSTSTIVTLDIWKRYFEPEMPGRRAVTIGRLVTAVTLVIAMALAPLIGKIGGGVFLYIQNLYAHFAPAFSAIFVVGILWRRATGKAAAWTIPVGLAASAGVGLAFPEMALTVRPIIVWVFCVLFMAAVSLLDAPPPPECVTDDLTMNWKKIGIFGGLGKPWFRNVLFWWLVFVACIGVCYVAFSGLASR
jgi:solute:Na+ symporter, SSS family